MSIEMVIKCNCCRKKIGNLHVDHISYNRVVNDKENEVLIGKIVRQLEIKYNLNEFIYMIQSPKSFITERLVAGDWKITSVLCEKCYNIKSIIE